MEELVAQGWFLFVKLKFNCLEIIYGGGGQSLEGRIFRHGLLRGNFLVDKSSLEWWVLEGQILKRRITQGHSLDKRFFYEHIVDA